MISTHDGWPRSSGWPERLADLVLPLLILGGAAVLLWAPVANGYPLLFSVVNALIVGATNSLDTRYEVRVVWLIPVFLLPVAIRLTVEELASNRKSSR
jgi:hypothetical protein